MDFSRIGITKFRCVLLHPEFNTGYELLDT